MRILNNLSPVSFKAKIPIALCTIQNRASKSAEHAIMYEYTCSDESDINEIKRITEEKEWEFGYSYLVDSECKYSNSIIPYNNRHFYTLENEKKETIGMCETREKNEIEVLYLEAQKAKKYRYVGQSILATLAKKVFNVHARGMLINDAVDTAMDFYQDACGFDEIYEIGGITDIWVDRKTLYKLIKQVENNTERKIIDLSI